MAIAESLKNSKILLAGCGNLGGSIARMLMSDGAEVHGLRRHTDKLPTGVIPLRADLTRPHTLAGKLPNPLDVVIYCLTPSEYTEQGYRAAYVTGLENLLHELHGQPLKRLFFISSSAVYGQNDGAWVDENSATEPTGFNGEQVLKGEQIALESPFPGTVIRFSGIYGPSRQSFLQAVTNGRLKPDPGSHYSNRIHEGDAARVIHHLSALALADASLQSCYLASDCEPTKSGDVVDWIRRQTPCAEPVQDARSGGRVGSKLCSNRRLLETGFVFRYPDFRAGYRELINQHHGV